MSKSVLNCIIVDDSSLQRLSIVKLIKTHSSLNLVAQFNNAIDARAGLEDNSIDLIFLDVEMPVLSGFDFLDKLSIKPQIIFVTGKTKYAFKAFHYDAVDYLQKPITKDRFLMAVHKAEVIHNLKLEEGFEEEEFIFVKSNLKKRKVFINELRYIEALGDYLKIVTEHDSLVVLSTMKDFNTLLPADKFLRIHKSYIINLQKVIKYDSKFVELGLQKLPLSRYRKTDLAESLARLKKT